MERRLLRLLNDCRRTLNPLQLRSLHAHIFRNDLHQSNLLLSHFVSICGVLGHIRYSHLVFQHCSNPNILLFNSVIKSHSLSREPSIDSVRVYGRMRTQGVFPDRFTFAPLLKSCSKLSDSSLGCEIHAATIVTGFESHSSVQIGLLEFYCAFDKNRISDAQKVFDEMSKDTIIASNLMISGLCRHGDLETAHKVFRGMSEPNVVTWNTMIKGFAVCRGQHDTKALSFFREMWDLGLEPDDATLVTVLPVCARLGALDIGRLIHLYADQKGFIDNPKTTHVGNSIIDMYNKCGDLQNAAIVFDKLPKKNLVSWNVMISGLGFHGKGEACLDIFERMKKHGTLPNFMTYTGLLGCCARVGLVQRGLNFFDSMVNEHGIEPRIEHYGCIVDLLGRDGRVEEAFDLIKQMPIDATPAIWGALLSASRIHNKVDIAEHAAKQLVDAEQWNSEIGRWDDVEKVRLMMMKNNIIKSAGQSLSK
ncbi:Pentatricopeptide repeat-containing protein [Zostera marina]|uniref:Pentatricopeptide repeat-containing protein n=1 Tax=Zostera marina TaxID=29655 RepID=A0A0K9Q0N4_ZOSMR|nr:Pentatricopeptide repeat-containing protein [Zostera marina]